MTALADYKACARARLARLNTELNTVAEKAIHLERAINDAIRALGERKAKKARRILAEVLAEEIC